MCICIRVQPVSGFQTEKKINEEPPIFQLRSIFSPALHYLNAWFSQSHSLGFTSQLQLKANTICSPQSLENMGAQVACGLCFASVGDWSQTQGVFSGHSESIVK